MEGKTVLITGGTGSLGQVLVARLLSQHKPAKVIVLDIDENELQRFRTRIWQPESWPVEYVCADVADYEALLMATMAVDYVIHCAAMKHVSVCEENPHRARRVNIDGTANLQRACVRNGVAKCISISTDKAVHPVCAYGAMKATADSILVTKDYPTIFSVIRFGNFLRSRGSVFDGWKERYDRGERCLPLTDERATRFFITIQDAADFTISWLARCRGGEIVSPKMKSYHMVDVFKAAYGEDCTFQVTGLQRGEKLHEKLVASEWAAWTKELDDCYVTDFLGLWKDQGKPVPEGFCYGSEDGCQSS